MIIPRKLSYYFARSKFQQRTATSHLYLIKLTSIRAEITSTLGCRADFMAQGQEATAYTCRLQQLTIKYLWELSPPLPSICSSTK